MHCPFCVRVRMALNYLNIPFESRVLSYDNEVLPVQLSGKKMLPIVVFSDGKVMNESLDIIEFADKNGSLFKNVNSEQINNVSELTSVVGSYLHPLAMPAWLNTLEFIGPSRDYFRLKKEKKRGPFADLLKNEVQLKNELIKFFQEMEIPENFISGDYLTILDIMLASHLYGVYVLSDFSVPLKIHLYLQRVRKICKFNYHEDYKVDTAFSHFDGE